MTAIDLTLVSFNLKPLTSWSILVDRMVSDHSPMSVNIGIPFISYHFFFHKYNLNRVDWRVFRSELLSIRDENKLPLLSNSLNILDAYHKFVKDIDDALDKANTRLDRKPSRKIFYPSPPPPPPPLVGSRNVIGWLGFDWLG